MVEDEWAANSDAAVAEIKKGIDELLEDIDRHILNNCIKFVKYTVKTNYFLPTKTGLAFHIDPNVLDANHYRKLIYGIFFSRKGFTIISGAMVRCC